MFLRRRRPLLGAAMLGGAVMAGRASQRAQYREQDQDARIDQLETQLPPAAAPPPAAAAPATSPPDQGRARPSARKRHGARDRSAGDPQGC